MRIQLNAPYFRFKCYLIVGLLQVTHAGVDVCTGHKQQLNDVNLTLLDRHVKRTALLACQQESK